MSFAVFFTLSTFAASADAAVRLTYMLQDKPTSLAWSPQAFPITYVVDSSAAQLAARRADVDQGFGAWMTPNSAVAFESAAPRPIQGGRDKVNSISVADQLFKDSGFIAYTTTWFDSSGRIEEADIQIDPSAFGATNLEALIEHEVGHLLGLDHAANLASAMYPYVGPSAVPIAQDDALTIAALYPKPSFAVAMSALSGEVRTAQGGVFGAQVVAVAANGGAVATTLTDSSGAFEFQSLPPGSYRIYAEPLDGPVEKRNFSGIFQGANSSFRTAFASQQQITLAAGERRDGVSLAVDTLPATLNPRWIGTFAANSSDVRLSSLASTVKAGDTVSIAVGGDGIVGGMTTFEVSSDAVGRVSDFRYGSNYVWATFSVKRDAESAPLVVIVRSGNETATLTGALRVEAGGSTRPRPIRR